MARDGQATRQRILQAAYWSFYRVGFYRSSVDDLGAGGYALARLNVPFRGLMMLVFLLPQAFPNLPIYINVARIFYWIGLNGTIAGVVLVHSLHGLVLSVWIAAAAFAAVERSLEEAARNMGAGPVRTFFTVSLPLAAPGIMAAAVFVFLESLDEFTGTYFVGVPDIITCPC